MFTVDVKQQCNNNNSISGIRGEADALPWTSPTLFIIFLERIMSVTLEEHSGNVSILVGGRNMTNLRFADDIDAIWL